MKYLFIIKTGTKISDHSCLLWKSREIGRPRIKPKLKIEIEKCFDDADFNDSTRLFVDFDDIVKSRDFSTWLTASSATPFYQFDLIVKRMDFNWFSCNDFFRFEDKNWENFKLPSWPFGMFVSRNRPK